jgi:hypothetical protein
VLEKEIFWDRSYAFLGANYWVLRQCQADSQVLLRSNYHTKEERRGQLSARRATSVRSHYLQYEVLHDISPTPIRSASMALLEQETHI